MLTVLGPANRLQLEELFCLRQGEGVEKLDFCNVFARETILVCSQFNIVLLITPNCEFVLDENTIKETFKHFVSYLVSSNQENLLLDVGEHCNRYNILCFSVIDC